MGARAGVRELLGQITRPAVAGLAVQAEEPERLFTAEVVLVHQQADGHADHRTVFERISQLSVLLLQSSQRGLGCDERDTQTATRSLPCGS